MKRQFNRKILFSAALILLAAGMLHAQQSAAEIIDKSRKRIQSETVSTRSRMEIRAKNGNITERVIDQYSKDDAQGNSRTVIVFQSPSSVAGTRFLTRENANRDNDQWIFQPSLGNRARRLVASEG